MFQGCICWNYKIDFTNETSDWFNWAINTQLEVDLLILPHRGNTTSLTSLLSPWKELCTYCKNATGLQFELSCLVRVVNE